MKDQKTTLPIQRDGVEAAKLQAVKTSSIVKDEGYCEAITTKAIKESKKAG